MEMSFVEQEDVFKAVEPIFFKLFSEFGKGKSVSKISNIRDEYLVELQKLRKKYEKKLR